VRTFPPARTWPVVVDEGGAALDTRELSSFAESCRTSDRHAPFEEHTLLTLQGQRQVRHARLIVRERGALMGCAVLSEGLDAWTLELATHPTARNRGIGRALLESARGHVASHGGGPLRHWVHTPSPAVDQLGSRATVTRTLLILRRCLHTTLPDAVGAVRSMQPCTDRDAWLQLTNAAFAGHPENGGWQRSDLDWRVDADWTDQACWPVVEDGERLLAGVWTKIEPAAASGELYIVAVDPLAQGRGLGRLVVADALRRLAARGCRSAFLYVDADNTPAIRLYRWAGFEQDQVHRCLQEQVRAASRSLHT